MFEVNGYTVRRPKDGPSDEYIRQKLDLQEDGEMAFQLGILAFLTLTGGSIEIKPPTYEA